MIVELKDEGPKCPLCGIRAIKLLQIPTIELTAIKLGCRHCKKKFIDKHNLSIEDFEKNLAIIRDKNATNNI